MNRREWLRRCYFHEELDRPAVYSRTGFPHADPTYDDRLKAYLREHTELKIPWDATATANPYPVERRVEPVSEDYERHIRVLYTPAGELTASREWTRTSS